MVEYTMLVLGWKISDAFEEAKGLLAKVGKSLDI